MADRTRERLKNQGIAFTRDVAKIQLELARVRLSPEWTRHPAEEPSNDRPTEKPTRQVAGG